MSRQLVIVIHAEEEFDWDGGFYRSNMDVTHADHLISVMDRIIELGGKITLAMDYPFITSMGGQKVVNRYRAQHGQSIEFATHLHPWVNPPFEDGRDEVANEASYPGNLSYDIEYEKLKVLTETIEQVSGVRPITYLAGRYGVGPNTQKIIKALGYQVDLSISSYCDFRHQQGPDFSRYSNRRFEQNELTYLPHTSSILAVLPPLRDYLNRRPETFTWIQQHRWFRLASKFLRVKRYRLSPEGFTAKQMAQVTQAQLAVGQQDFIMSFHSPTTKQGLTPYTRSDEDVARFVQTIETYLVMFTSEFCGKTVLPSMLITSDSRG
ncbi:hypothetical protein LDJ79_17955 [Vibrio tritonius]|uniref:WalW protein n=1 Tax=Vibrio tritonius TaxID=1435069 RepID=A0ABS7YQQ3_9VIBR|nr:hypothetical protein [Vibrio tritonius]MCA2018010.1 hypothetical protein [Vibrio tritonius]